MSDVAALPYRPDVSLPARLRRRLVQWRTAARLNAAPTRTLVSVTFDDFPRSAADNGASLLEAYGGRGGFYACTGLEGRCNASGELFSADDIVALDRAGHEIGGHGNHHMDCAQAPVEQALSDISLNLQRLRQMGLQTPVRQFAYPYGETRPELKLALRGRFDAARGVLAGVNRRGADLMQLRAFELDGDETSHDRCLDAIERAARQPAWLVIFTHDVCGRPSPFGTTPSALRAILRKVRDTGAVLRTPSEALAEIRGKVA